MLRVTITKVDNGYIIKSGDEHVVVEEDQSSHICDAKNGADTLRVVRDMLGMPNNDNSTHIRIGVFDHEGNQVEE